MQCRGPTAPEDERGIQPVGFLPRTRVDGLDGVQRRPGLVVRLDALEVGLDKRPARCTSGLEGAAHLVDCGLHHMESRRLRQGRRRLGRDPDRTGHENHRRGDIR
jgi:hypothetical protein